MGVRTLRAFAYAHERVTSTPWPDPAVPHGGPIVCDGYAWLFSVAFSPRCRTRYGVDLAQLHAEVVRQARCLQAAGFAPMVLLDGLSEERKRATQLSRAADREAKVDRWVEALASTDPQSGVATAELAPLHATAVFVAALAAAGVRVTVCPGEADDAVAVLALQLGCPVLTVDSDFLVVPGLAGVVLLGRLDFVDGGDAGAGAGVRGRLFTNRGVAKALGVRAELLPYLAVLVGNDFVELTDGQLAQLLRALMAPRTPRSISSGRYARLLAVADALQGFASAAMLEAAMDDAVSEHFLGKAVHTELCAAQAAYAPASTNFNVRGGPRASAPTKV